MTPSRFASFGRLFGRSSRQGSRARPRVEPLEDRSVPTVTLPTPGSPGPVLLTGTEGADRFVVRHAPRAWATPLRYFQFSDDGGATFHTVAAANVTSIAVSGRGSDDQLTFDFSQGFVGKSQDAGGLQVTYDGGTNLDVLVFTGDPGKPIERQLGTQSDADTGTVSLESDYDRLTVRYDNVESVVDQAGGRSTPAPANATWSSRGGFDAVAVALASQKRDWGM